MVVDAGGRIPGQLLPVALEQLLVSAVPDERGWL